MDLQELILFTSPASLQYVEVFLIFIFLEMRKHQGTSKKYHEEYDELTEKNVVTENDYVKANVLEEQIKQRHVIEFGKRKYFADNSPFSILKFSIKPQPAFNRQFNLLIQNL